MMRLIPLICLFLILPLTNAFGEYRAFLIEVYDHIDKKKFEQVTGFSPDKYIITHGGGNRFSVFVKATWMCYGDTSKFKQPCPMPDPIQPKFQKGQRVKIKLEKHITQGWIGVIELAYFQGSVNSNVYGVRFGEKRQLYNRYYEFDLENAAPATPVPPAEGEENQIAQPTAAAGAPAQNQ